MFANSIALRLLLASGVIGAVGGSAYFSDGGMEALLSGAHRTILGDVRYVKALRNRIHTSASIRGLPPEIVATVLLAEIMDYNIKDTLGDDWVLTNPEKHSTGIAQIRIDTARKWHLRNWNESTPASEIRSTLNNPEEAVDLLAELLKKIYVSAAPGHRASLRLNQWNQLSDEERLDVATQFVSAKDQDELSYDGKLAAVAPVAFAVIHKSGLFPPYHFH